MTIDGKALCPPHRRVVAAADAWLDELATASQPAAVVCTCPESPRWPHYGDPMCPQHRVDSDALESMFPNWERDLGDEPPVNAIAGEIRARADADRAVDKLITRQGPVSAHDERMLRDFAGDITRRAHDIPDHAFVSKSHDLVDDKCTRCGACGEVDVSCAEWLMEQSNMYGCRPCPVCKAEFRTPHRSGYVICDDCGHEAKARRFTGDDVEGLTFDVWVDDEPRVSIADLVLDATKEIRKRVLGPDSTSRRARDAKSCSRRHNRCDGCGGCAVVARDYPLANDCRACDWSTCPTAIARLRGPLTKSTTATNVASKAAHVRGATQTREHACHWPGCEKQVPPAKWGCAAHWRMLPRELQDAIWNAYRPGQEETLDVSSEYLDVAKRVQRWCRDFVEREAREGRAEPRRTTWTEATRRVRERDAARVVESDFDPDVGDR